MQFIPQLKPLLWSPPLGTSCPSFMKIHLKELFSTLVARKRTMVAQGCCALLGLGALEYVLSFCLGKKAWKSTGKTIIAYRAPNVCVRNTENTQKKKRQKSIGIISPLFRD